MHDAFYLCEKIFMRAPFSLNNELYVGEFEVMKSEKIHSF